MGFTICREKWRLISQSHGAIPNNPLPSPCVECSRTETHSRSIWTRQSRTGTEPVSEDEQKQVWPRGKLVVFSGEESVHAKVLGWEWIVTRSGEAKKEQRPLEGARPISSLTRGVKLDNGSIRWAHAWASHERSYSNPGWGAESSECSVRLVLSTIFGVIAPGPSGICLVCVAGILKGSSWPSSGRTTTICCVLQRWGLLPTGLCLPPCQPRITCPQLPLPPEIYW